MGRTKFKSLFYIPEFAYLYFPLSIKIYSIAHPTPLPKKKEKYHKPPILIIQVMHTHKAITIGGIYLSKWVIEVLAIGLFIFFTDQSDLFAKK